MNSPLPASAVPSSTLTNASTLPSKIPDLPVSVVLSVIYFTCAIFNMIRIAQSKKKFIVQGLLIGLCMSRTVTFAVRAAWSNNPLNRNLAIASAVFVGAGVILLCAANFQMYFRLLKTLRPELQLNKLFTRGTTAVQFFLIALLLMTVVPAVQNILTTSSTIRAQDQIVLKISSTYLAIYACLPFILSPLSYVLIPKSPRSIASTRLPIKFALVSYVSALVGTELALRCANLYHPMRWYGERTEFYVLTPMLELLCIVPLILFNLPHSFGDSNAAVLDAINSRWQSNSSSSAGEKETEDNDKVSENEHGLSGAMAVERALQQTSPHYTPGLWTVVPADLARGTYV